MAIDLEAPRDLPAEGLDEIRLQEIWATGEVRALTLTDGRPLEVLSPGRWNRLEGPDFVGAELRVGEVTRYGDIEFHLDEADWGRHGHAGDPRYDRVVLHVVASRPVASSSVEGPRGSWLAWLGGSPLEDWRQAPVASGAAVTEVDVVAGARRRWQRKLAEAQRRVRRFGFGDAAHLSVLEVLGFPRNRTPMLRLGLRYPLRKLARVPLRRLIAEEGPRWKRNGLRPANDPVRRLGGYLDTIARHPDWPWEVREALSSGESQSLNAIMASTFPTLGVGRRRTLAVDAIWPLLARGDSNGDWFRTWLTLPLGNHPESYQAAKRGLPLPSGWKRSANGLFQAWLSHRES